MCLSHNDLITGWTAKTRHTVEWCEFDLETFQAYTKLLFCDSICVSANMETGIPDTELAVVLWEWIYYMLDWS